MYLFSVLAKGTRPGGPSLVIASAWVTILCRNYPSQAHRRKGLWGGGGVQGVPHRGGGGGGGVLGTSTPLRGRAIIAPAAKILNAGCESTSATALHAYNAL